MPSGWMREMRCLQCEGGFERLWWAAISPDVVMCKLPRPGSRLPGRYSGYSREHVHVAVIGDAIHRKDL